MTDPEEKYEILIGTKIQDKYLLKRIVGYGGMGVVFEAENVFIRRTVALKMLHPDLAQDDEIIQRFSREGQAAALIGHRNIVDILDFGSLDEGTPFIVMEYLKGESLLDILRNRERLNTKEVLQIIFQVLSALIAAHNKGIIHRDLKPANIFVKYDASGEAEARILDFGLSKFAANLVTARPGLTMEGAVLGTPRYMSPEQARGDRNIDGRADVYSVGTILYELLTGKAPFDDKNYNVLMAKILMERPPAPHMLRPEISRDLEAVVLRAMDRRMSSRYARAEDLMNALMPFFKGEKECFTSEKISIIPLTEEYESETDGGKEALAGVPVATEEIDGSFGHLSIHLKEETEEDEEDGVTPKRRTVVNTRTLIFAAACSALITVLALYLLATGGGYGKYPKRDPNEPEEISAEAETAPSAETDARPMGLLLILAEPEDALIIVNGIVRAGRKFSIPLGTGPHRIRVQAKGYEPFEKSFETFNEKDLELKVRLVKSNPKNAELTAE